MSVGFTPTFSINFYRGALAGSPRLMTQELLKKPLGQDEINEITPFIGTYADVYNELLGKSPPSGDRVASAFATDPSEYLKKMHTYQMSGDVSGEIMQQLDLSLRICGTHPLALERIASTVGTLTSSSVFFKKVYGKNTGRDAISKAFEPLCANPKTAKKYARNLKIDPSAALWAIERHLGWIPEVVREFGVQPAVFSAWVEHRLTEDAVFKTAIIGLKLTGLYRQYYYEESKPAELHEPFETAAMRAFTMTAQLFHGLGLLSNDTRDLLRARAEELHVRVRL